jgi:quercetin dioxygenase-like cupin family protein
MGNFAMQEQEFRRELEAQGYADIGEFVFEKNQAFGEHTHEWGQCALVMDGEYILTAGDEVSHFKAGEICKLAANSLHQEAAGPDGARLLFGKLHANGAEGPDKR